MTSVSVTAVVLTWNSRDFIIRCLDSLVGQEPITEVLVVDNCSSDDTCELVRTRHPEVHLHQTGGNYGFSGGVNRGIQLALESDFVFLLNPDAYVAPGAVGRLVATMNAQPAAAAASPVIKNSTDDTIWYAGSSIDWRDGHTPHQVDPPSGVQHWRTERISGCAALVRISSILEIGVLDDAYFLYYEETDWSVRFSRAGGELLVVSDAVAWHDASSSTGGAFGRTYQYYMTRNRLYFLRKFGKPLAAALVGTILLNVRELKYVLSRRGIVTCLHVARAMAAGVTDAVTGQMGRRI